MRRRSSRYFGLNLGRSACSGLSLSRTLVTPSPSPTWSLSSSRAPMSRWRLPPCEPPKAGASSILSMMSLSSVCRAVSARSEPRSLRSVMGFSLSGESMPGGRSGSEQPDEQQGPGGAERPAADHVARPVDLQHRSAQTGDESDGQSEGDRRPPKPRARREQGDGEPPGHRIGRMAAREGQVMDRDLVAERIGAGAVEDVLHAFDEQPLRSDDGDEQDGAAAVAAQQQPGAREQG